MLKANAQSRPASRTRQKILDAALKTLSREGYAGTTARAIAGAGGFNQALIFYHFGNVHDLLLAALDETSERRLRRYREAVAEVQSLTELVALMRTLYEEDLAEGHVAVVQELAAGASSDPALAQQVVRRIDPWVDFGEEVISRFLGGSFFESMVRPRDAAFAIVALYFGMETVAHLDRERVPTASLFDTATRLAPMVDMLLKGGPPT
jgi:AcrR family transcriptional regulator